MSGNISPDASLDLNDLRESGNSSSDFLETMVLNSFGNTGGGQQPLDLEDESDLEDDEFDDTTNVLEQLSAWGVLLVSVREMKKRINASQQRRGSTIRARIPRVGTNKNNQRRSFISMIGLWGPKDIAEVKQIAERDVLGTITTTASELDDADIDMEALALHEMFCDFCSPHPTYNQILKIVEHFRPAIHSRPFHTDSPKLLLPSPTVISVREDISPVVRLLIRNPKHVLLRLPIYFQLAFFHILIRLITGEDYTKYTQYCFREIHKPHSHDQHPSNYPPLSYAPSSNLIYSIVRFCSQHQWEPFATPLQAMLNLFHLILKDAPASNQLILPLSRLIGLVAAPSLSVHELRVILDIIAQKNNNLISNETRTFLLKALAFAADAIPPSTPKCFFSFSIPSQFQSSGIQTTLPFWPFKTDLGIVVSFRAETFANEEDPPTLIYIKTEDGAGFQVQFEPTPSDNKPMDNDTPATITIFIHENKQKFISIPIPNSTLSTRTWYHLAIRHTATKFKNLFSLPTPDEMQVFLNNKLIFSEEVKFTKIKPAYMQPPNASPFYSNSSSDTESLFFPVQLQFAQSFVGQTDPLYLFKDFLTDASLDAFYKQSFHHTHNIMEKQASIEDMQSFFSLDLASSTLPKLRDNSAQNSHHFFALDENADDPIFAPELSRPNFGFKLAIAIDPHQVIKNSFIIDPLLGGHIFFKESHIQAWTLVNVRDVIISLGGISTILKVADNILGGSVPIPPKKNLNSSNSSTKDNTSSNDHRRTKAHTKHNIIFGRITTISDIMDQRHGVVSLIPSIIFLLASFIRNHNNNARDMLKCRGIEILEKIILHNKRLGLNALSTGLKVKNEVDYMMLAIRNSPALSQLLVDALLDLRAASAHNAKLQERVVSKMICNLSLWFGDVTNTPGVALHGALLPVLSAMAKFNPSKMRGCIEIKEIIEIINEFSIFPKSSLNLQNNQENFNDHPLFRASPVTLFYRNSRGEIPFITPMTLEERRHATHVLVGVIATVMSSNTQSNDLVLLLQFISYNLEIVVQETKEQNLNSSGILNISPVTKERYLATTIVCTVLLFLLQMRPPIPCLFKSLESCFNDTDGAATFFLCSMIDTSDDFLRSIGIRCLTAFLEVVSLDENSSPAAVVDDKDDNSSIGNSPEPISTSVDIPTQAITGAIKYVGTGLFRYTHNNAVVSSKANLKILYRLLWHLLKNHRERIGEDSHAALIDFLIEGDFSNASSIDDILKPDEHLGGGYCLNADFTKHALTTVGTESNQKFRDVYSITVILHILKFLPVEMKQRWLFDLLTLIRIVPNSIKAVLPNQDWQPSLFVISDEVVKNMTTKAKEVLWSKDSDESKNSIRLSRISAAGSALYDLDDIGDDLYATNADINAELSKVAAMSGQRSSVSITSDEEEEDLKDDGNFFPKRKNSVTSDDLDIKKPDPDPLAQSATMFDLCFKLYSILLGHSVREGGEKAFVAIEQASYLQRICNGNTVTCILLSHLIGELTANGTVPDIENICPEKMKVTGERHRFLKMSARVVTTALLTNGSDGIDMATAKKQWGSLRHLTAIAVAVITKCGFGVANLFDTTNFEDSAIDLSGGLYGIRLPDGSISGVSASEILDDTRFIAQAFKDENKREKFYEAYAGNRRVCVTVAAQLLSLLDAFIFPDSLDAAIPASQLYGLGLVKGTEPRLGKTQGPLLASLVRLSLLLIAHLEPSSIKFLQSCSRLRCFLHWTLEIIRESVALGGYNNAFHVLTAQLDRLVLSVVIQCHHALSKCSKVLMELESSSSDDYFGNTDNKQKNYRRIFRSSSELREIVLAAYRGRNEVLRVALSPDAYKSLQLALEEIVAGRRQQFTRKISREASLRSFMSNNWVQDFQSSSRHGISVPPLTKGGKLTKSEKVSNLGHQAIQELFEESKRIVDEYEKALDSPFECYCQEQRMWAETDNLVFESEHKGKSAINRLTQGFVSVFLNDDTKNSVNESDEIAQNWKIVDRRVSSFWSAFDTSCFSSSICTQTKHWKLAKYADRLQRRVLFSPDRNFDPHIEAAYESIMSREQKAYKVLSRFFRQRRIHHVVKVVSLSASQSQITFDPFDLNSDSDTEDASDKESLGRVGILEGIEEQDEEEDEDDVEEADAPDDHIVGNVTFIEDEIEDAEEVSGGDSCSWAREFTWLEGEEVVQSFDKVSIVTLQTITDGELLLTNHSLYFRPYGDTINIMTRESSNEAEDGIRCWRLSRLTEVHGRRYILRAQAVELFFVDCLQIFLNFSKGPKIRDKFYNKLRNHTKVPMLHSPKSLNPRFVFKKSKVSELWRKRKISNFQYIMQLNSIAGRTYNDITQYPVFPWILADYTSQKLDLNDPKSYRDLSKPVGALNPERLQQLLERYNDLDGFPEEEKFLYGSHYSSPGVVLHYMIRQEPFTTMAIQLQSGRFDCPDRLFFDIGGCWDSCLKSTSDVKELIPEFFTCPEVLINTNGYHLGETQSKIKVNHVKLPPWANGSPYEFVRIHALALESEYVSQNLHRWIDLIFGYQQQGAEALKANNLFHHLSYEGTVDLDMITNEVDRKATESHIQNFGQTPSQLLAKEAHPPRLPLEECWSPLLNDLNLLRELRCFTPRKQFGGGSNAEAIGAVLSIHAFTDTIAVVYADMSVGTYKCSYNRNATYPYTFKNDKLRPLGCRSISLSSVALCANATAANDLPYSLVSSKNQSVHDNITQNNMLVGSWCFAVTVGGSLMEKNLRNNTIGSVSSRIETTAGSAITSSKDVSSSLLVSCGYKDNTVKVHTFDGLRLKCSESGGHVGPINCLTIGDDGGIMITGGQDCTCRVWVVKHPDMAAALSDSQVSVKEQLLSCINILWGHEAPITCVSFSSDLDINLSGSANGTICVHTVRRCRFIRAIYVGAESRKKTTSGNVQDSFGCGNSQVYPAVRKLDLDSSGTFVVYLEDFRLISYTVNGKKLSETVADDVLHSIQISTGGQMLVTGSQNGHVVIRTLNDLAVRCVLDLSVHGPIRSISFTTPEFNPMSELMYIGTEDGRVTIVDRDKLQSKETENDGLPLWTYHDGLSSDDKQNKNNWWIM